ncbi:hypothetical protein FisN_30Hh037 [Fistulifera solaris]|uniref:Uncharacterized protein n=1 Tax=Fistulifera solaris TaxID=1519565 RepID=A0A1Z5K6G1_FISSO|nr:hypothetical protein FisN_30Hh037 [Fistulifera solaris]|eukprot:GAX21837.1 hypothetical protein FisN_30Hh037 [Fistulifera solaris]
MLRRITSVIEAISPRRTKEARESPLPYHDDVEAHLHASDTSRRRLSDNPRYHSNATLDEIASTTTAISPTHRRISVEEAPKSRGSLTPLLLQQHEPRLLHPLLNKIPLHVRFGFNGLCSSIWFMIAYNAAVHSFQKIPAPTLYSCLYLLFIPLQHVMTCLLVFGWPDRYLQSLMANVPIGLTAIALGSALTAALDQYQFNEQIEDWIRNNFTFSRMPPRTPSEKSEFYSSLVVLAVTSLWTYVLSVCINSPATVSDKKQL